MYIMSFVFLVTGLVSPPPIYNEHKSVDLVGRVENFMGDFTKLEYREFCHDHQRMPVSLLYPGTVKV